ncbi:MAG TPA: CheR family methyltransferase [Opitutaceae bacterium]|jgi:chemotaxis protein methyltransferase CheR|nr:CheR family methyltransferase [Opitutaceae bacterium]
MRDDEFEFIRTLVYERSRISLDDRKRDLVIGRLAKRMRANGIEAMGDYCAMLNAPENEDERSRMIDAISTNHTFFFREIAHFQLLRERIIPEMAARARSERWQRLNAWSAASSSGEEPYSMGITFAEGLKDRGLNWHIEATDISHRMLKAGQMAVYKESAVTPHTPAWALPYFQKGFAAQSGNFRVRADIRDDVRFSQLNLLEGAFPFAEPVQVIFCRNVMIYFDKPTQEELVNRLSKMLVPGGYLVVGHSEGLTGVQHTLEMIQPSVYRRSLTP